MLRPHPLHWACSVEELRIDNICHRFVFKCDDTISFAMLTESADSSPDTVAVRNAFSGPLLSIPFGATNAQNQPSEGSYAQVMNMSVW